MLTPIRTLFVPLVRSTTSWNIFLRSGVLSSLGQSQYGRPTVQPVLLLTGVQPRAQEIPSEAGSEIVPGTTYTRHLQKSEKSESHSSQKSESQKTERITYTSGGQGGIPAVPVLPLTGNAPPQTGQDGAVGANAEVPQQVGGEQLRGPEISPRQLGGIRQQAQIRQNAASQGGGSIQQSANINQVASGGGQGGIDQTANVGQQALSRSAPSAASSAASIKQRSYTPFTKMQCYY